MRPTSYHVPPGGADRAALEGFRVYPADADEPVGKVGAVLERDDSRFLVVELDGVPTRPHRRFVSCEAVAEVDTAARSVRLSIPQSELEDARQLDAPPRAESRPAAGPITFLPIATAALMGFTLLGTLALYGHTRNALVLVALVLPVAFAAATAAALYGARRA